METTIEAYTPEWFKSRQGCFTGSEVWKLMTEPRTKADKEAGNLSETANTYILEKVWEKLSGLTKSGVDNFATEWGNDNEPKAVHFYEKLTGNKCEHAPCCFNPDVIGLSGTPDRKVNGDGLIEVKCPFNGANHLKHCFITSDEYFKSEHKEYYWQIQCYLFLTDREWCDFVSFDPRVNSDFGMFIYRLKKNEQDIKEMVEKVTKARELFEGYYTTFKG